MWKQKVTPELRTNLNFIQKTQMKWGKEEKNENWTKTFLCIYSEMKDTKS